MIFQRNNLGTLPIFFSEYIVGIVVQFNKLGASSAFIEFKDKNINYFIFSLLLDK